MDAIPYPPKVDLTPFARENTEPEAKYGLPVNIKFCRRCIISNQRPSYGVEYESTRDTRKTTINFDEEGICDACRVKENKENTIDWDARERELRELCDQHRKTNGSYDCVVPGSGGKDSFYAAHVLKYTYDMHPLTVTWAPNIYTEWGWANFQRWIGAGFDNHLCTPNGRVIRLLTRLAVENLFHPFQAFTMGQKFVPIKTSGLHKIPLVFYGEQPSEYGTKKSGDETPLQDYQPFASEDNSHVHIAGLSLGVLKKNFGLSDNDLSSYMPADISELRDVGTQIHCLGYYLKWHPQSNYYYAQKHGGFQPSPERTVGSYSKYSSIDDRIDDFHYYTTFIKFGIGRATYDAAQEVRSGDITRDEGVALIKRYDGEFPERFAKEIFRYLSISEEEFPVASKMFEQPIMDREYFDRLTDQFRSPHLWKYEDGAWSLRRAVWRTNV